MYAQESLGLWAVSNCDWIQVAASVNLSRIFNMMMGTFFGVH
jgi:hypothetical protein